MISLMQIDASRSLAQLGALVVAVVVVVVVVVKLGLKKPVICPGGLGGAIELRLFGGGFAEVITMGVW